MQQETKTHSTSSVRACQNCKLDFVIETEDFKFYEKMKVPVPTFCPDCRMQRRMAFQVSRELYRNVCGLCGKNIITQFAPEHNLKVYCNPCWWSDKWDGAEYAQDIDFSRPFLEQLKELYRITPQMASETNYPTLINSEYVNHAGTAKNCYLIFFSDECENILYSEYMLHDKDSMDCTMFSFCELSYGTIASGKCFRTFFSEDCENCFNMYFSKDCFGCSNCFGCMGLRNKQYHIFNQPYTKEEYEKKIQEFGVDSYKNLVELKKQAHAFWLKYPHKFAHMLRNLNVTGEYVYESKNSKDMYDVSQGAEDSRFCQLLSMSGTKDAYDYSIWGNQAERIYEAMTVGEGAYNVMFSFSAWPNARDVQYCMSTISSSNCFGCANVRKKEYCILNKQYTKEEYEVLVPKIIQHMNDMPYVDKKRRVYTYGEFFPSELSVSGYNETYAADFIPLTREQALEKGFSWFEAKPSTYVPTLKPDNIPDRIGDVGDLIVNEIIECASCKKAFKIVKAELDLLRRFGLPAPRMCPTCRYQERWSRVNKPKLYSRECRCNGKNSHSGVYENTTAHFHGENKCPNIFQTAYAPDRPEIVYCEQCYQAEVV
ncbi:MAG: hypothetical protein Q7S10_03170 [bacterium]|nr:hypothetical protein [bacterium]